ncbi:MAG: rRNA pseudouridine synthase [Lachnospiraceae bacterium]|jgi:16S rRNA pseudouridine516 synthase|nr:rRNA pseudouridine synthase [Lachnospiraceae bacterium]
MRLDKYLCDMGIGTRSQVKEKIRKGLVTVEGALVQRPEYQVGKEQQVHVEGVLVSYTEMEYYMLNKPAGCVSARTDGKCQTVLDLIASKKRKDLFPVGRLDKDTEGLLLITNDGMLAHMLLSPRRHVDKTYEAKIRGWITEEHVKLFGAGLDIGEERPALPASLEILASGEVSEIQVTVQEGKYHQIKRMFQAVDCEVLYLKRLSMGSLKLDERLKPGEYRPLTADELAALQSGRIGMRGTQC